MLTKLHDQVEQLRLRGIAESLDEVLAEAQREGQATQDVLSRLLEVEWNYQQTRTLENRIKNAKLPYPWTLETFPFEEQPNINKVQIMDLAKLDFIRRHENIVLIGKPGTGKTGLAVGLLRLALINGYRCRFYNAQELLDELYASLADRTTSKLLKRIANYDLITIDELGYLTLNKEQINIFFKLIEMRYQNKPTIITTNLEYDDWYKVFEDKSLVEAMQDRFKHFCTTIKIDGASLRVPKENS